MSTLLCARAASAHISFASQAAAIYNRNRRRKKHLKFPRNIIIKKLKFQCLASICSQGVLFLPCGIDGAEKTVFKTKSDELGFLLAYPLRIFVVGPFCRFVFYGRMGARTHIFAEG